jgi:hypothetical protein
VKAYAITIHAVEMLNYGFGIRQIAGAVWALVIEPLADNLFVFFSINFNWPVLADLAA